MLPWEHNLQQYLCEIFGFASWTTTDSSVSRAAFWKRKGKQSFLAEGNFPIAFYLSVFGAESEPGCLGVLTLFSYGLRQITRFILNLNWITVFVLLCDDFCLCTGKKKNNFALDQSIWKVWFGIQPIRIIKFEMELLYQYHLSLTSSKKY